jgi:UPF0716 family protein affecting phage T7 exclusion
MTLATLAMLVAGIVALATGIPLDVAGLFLITAAPCALVTVSLYLVAVRGRGGEAAAVASQAVASQAVASQADESQAQEPQDEEPTAEPEPAATAADE